MNDFVTQSNWCATTLLKVAKIQTGPFGSQLHEKDYVKEGTPIITVEHLVNDKITHNNDIPKVSDRDKERLLKYVLQKGDIVFSRVGSVDRSAYVSEEERGWMFSGRLLRVRPNEEIIDRTYLHYWLTQKKIKKFVRKIAVGATMPSINTAILGEVPVNYPKISEQKTIASVLSSFDNKIKLLHNQNQTLEEMAQALFKEWFVDYRFPGVGKMVDSELGMIPEGWRVGKLEELLEIKYGKDHKHLENGKIPVYGSGGIMRYVNKFLYSDESILIPRKGTLSNLYYIKKPFWTVDTMFYTKIKNKYYGKYCFLLLERINLASMDVGSAVPSLTTKLLNDIKLIIPDTKTMETFDELASSIFKKKEFNEIQIQTLTQLRDKLLPKLMSGEIRVKS